LEGGIFSLVSVKLLCPLALVCIKPFTEAIAFLQSALQVAAALDDASFSGTESHKARMRLW